MKDLNIKKILAVIACQPRPSRIREISQKMKIAPSDYPNFRGMIKEALAEGALVKIKGGRLSLPVQDDRISGKLFVSRSGHGFVIPHEGVGDIFVSSRELGGAIHGEEVKVVIKQSRTGRSREGKIVAVMNREKGRVVGRVHRGQNGYYVVPDDPRIREKIDIDNPEKFAVDRDSVVLVRLYPWEAPFLPPRGQVEEVLGIAGQPGVDIDSLIISHGLPRDFDARVKGELAHIRGAIPGSELARRLDFRGRLTFTIDPADAKDHDDAISLEMQKDGRFLLGVHIADVSYYVKPEKALDEEAMLRGNSVYLVGRVIPMLPEKLSGDLCSLHEKVDRLTLSFVAEIDSLGKIYSWRFVESIIRSQASLSYEEVQDYLDDKSGGGIEEDKGKTLKMMLDLSRVLRARRFEKGGLDFDLPEPHVFLDPQGRVLDIVTKRRIPSMEIVEEFMLLANKYAALYLQRVRAPILFRVHARPDREKIENLAELLNEMGFNFNFKGEITPKKLQRVLEKVRGKPEEQFVEEILLRSLAKAAYQPENIGHFGLAFETYTHFTSPIRRYPDLLVHRTLKLALNNKLDAATFLSSGSQLKTIGAHCTATEIAAAEAERESMKIKQLEYLSERVGGVYDGIISGVIKSGFFVELVGSMVEGMVPFASIIDDYFELEEGKHRARGRRNKRIFKLGDKVEVIVVRVDLSQRRCDFALVDKPAKTKKSGRIEK